MSTATISDHGGEGQEFLALFHRQILKWKFNQKGIAYPLRNPQMPQIVAMSKIYPTWNPRQEYWRVAAKHLSTVRLDNKSW